KLGFLAGFELESAVAGSDSDCQGIHAGAGYKLLYLVRTGVGSVSVAYFYIILDACQLSQLALYYNTFAVSVLNHFFGQSDVLLEGMMRAVDHNRSKSAVDAGYADIEISAVIQVQSDGNIILNESCLHQFYQIGMVGIFSGAGGNLQDQGGFQFSRCFCDTLNDLHVVDIERADGVSSVIGLFEHLCRCY